MTVSFATNKDNFPELTVWITSTGRIDTLPNTIESFIKQCTYPNYKFVIVENQMTPESLAFFDPTQIKEKEVEEYLNSLPEKFPDVKFTTFIQPHIGMGEMYNQMLTLTSEYFVNLEDDSETVCDPVDQIIDGIKLLKADPKLLGLRVDLRDDTVYEGSPRFAGTKEAEGIKYVYWNICSGGAQLMDTAKVRALGGYYAEHPIDKYIQTEIHLQQNMRSAEMYTGVSLKYYGWWIHTGPYGIQGDGKNRQHAMYTSLLRKGWFGDGKNRKPLLPLTGRSTSQER